LDETNPQQGDGVIPPGPLPVEKGKITKQTQWDPSHKPVYPCKTQTTLSTIQGKQERYMSAKARFAKNKLIEYGKWFRAVLVLGSRQVGKTHLLRETFPNLPLKP
jgi:hypothetical protein